MEKRYYSYLLSVLKPVKTQGVAYFFSSKSNKIISQQEYLIKNKRIH